MKYLQTLAFVMIIGSIVVASTYTHQEALAMEHGTLENMVKVDKELSELKNMEGEFNELTMSKISFKVNQIKSKLLEINNANQNIDEKTNEMYEYLTNNMQKYFKNIKMM
jgi:cytochrome c biogenesis factor